MALCYHTVIGKTCCWSCLWYQQSPQASDLARDKTLRCFDRRVDNSRVSASACLFILLSALKMAKPFSVGRRFQCGPVQDPVYRSLCLMDRHRSLMVTAAKQRKSVSQQNLSRHFDASLGGMWVNILFQSFFFFPPTHDKFSMLIIPEDTRHKVKLFQTAYFSNLKYIPTGPAD